MEEFHSYQKVTRHSVVWQNAPHVNRLWQNAPLSGELWHNAPDYAKCGKMPQLLL